MRAENLRKGSWFEEEDERLKLFVAVLGARRWDSIARISGLRRSGKSCRLRWLNYLRPCLKQDPITPQEEQLILELHQKWGNKWAKIARRLPGRTDNEVKNYWRTHLRKNLQMNQNPLLLHHSPSSSSSNSVGSLVITSTSSDETTNSFIEIDTPPQEGDTAITITEGSCNNNNLLVSTDEYNEPSSGDIYDYNLDDKIGLLTDCIIPNSPYENRLSDWINTVSKEQSNDSSLGCWGSNGSSSELCLDYPITWSCLGDGIEWDFLDTKWDMILFNNVDGCLK